MQRMNQRDAASMRQFDSRWNLAQIEFLPTKYTCMLRYVMIRAITIHRLASRDTCHDVFAIKNTADFSEYLPSKFVGKNTSCELSKRCGAKCRKRKRGRRREKKSLSLSLSLRWRTVGGNLRAKGFSTNFPAALQITRFTVTNEREERGVGASRDSVVRAW